MRPVIGLFAGRTGVNCCDHPVRQIQSVEGIPPILGTHQSAEPAPVAEAALHPRVAKRRLDCDFSVMALSK